VVHVRGHHCPASGGRTGNELRPGFVSD
jgi:hypothetical protein